MVEVLKWAVLVVGAMMAAGCGAFLASAFALNRRADREQQQWERGGDAFSAHRANVTPRQPHHPHHPHQDDVEPRVASASRD